MTIQLDHILIPSKDRVAAAKQLAEILGVEWGPAKIGPFTAVHVSDSFTIDFDEWEQDFCVFRLMPGHSSGPCRAAIPEHAGPGFRSMPGHHSGACRAG